MASKNSKSFDDLTPVSPSTDDDDDVSTRKLEPGEELVAEIRHIEENVGQFDNTLLHLTDSNGTLCKFWSNSTIDNALEQADAGVGDTIGVRKAAEASTYVDDDDEEQEFYAYSVAVDTEGDD